MPTPKYHNDIPETVRARLDAWNGHDITTIEDAIRAVTEAYLRAGDDAFWTPSEILDTHVRPYVRPPEDVSPFLFFVGPDRYLNYIRFDENWQNPELASWRGITDHLLASWPDKKVKAFAAEINDDRIPAGDDPATLRKTITALLDLEGVIYF